jgi:lysophospholipase L1-like esterase
MDRRAVLFSLFLVLSACGGGSADSPAPQPVATPIPIVTGPVVFVGDSITEFWEVGPFTVPDPKLSQLVPGSVNAGVAGNTTDQMLARFSAVLEKKPSVVVILGGTNDLRQIEAPFTDNIAKMADRAAAAGARVVICTVPPASQSLLPTSVSGYSDATNDARIRQFNSQLKMLASGFGYQLADYYSAMVNVDGSQKVALFVSTDLIHPNTDGYRVMWPVVRTQLVALGVQGLAP